MDQNNICQCSIIHEDAVDSAKEKLIGDTTASSVAQLFKTLGDPTRIKILQALSSEELCVCDLTHVLNMTHSAISHQLKTLRQAGLVKNRKEGKVVYYSLDDAHVFNLLTQGIDHITHK